MEVTATLSKHNSIIQLKKVSKKYSHRLPRNGLKYSIITANMAATPMITNNCLIDGGCSELGTMINVSIAVQMAITTQAEIMRVFFMIRTSQIKLVIKNVYF